MNYELIIGFGEVLWDMLPQGRQLGGAPANFAYHVSQFGYRGVIVSAVGDDAQGQDIVKELEKPGRDPRDSMPKPLLRTDVLEMKDLKEGMILKGTVRNVIDFGAFVDIGVHQDGLVHISQLSDKKFVKHPMEVVSVGDVVEVKVMSVDLAKKRIQLTMKL